MAEVAHEVGTPLHSVAGHLELLRRQLPPEAPSELQELLAAMLAGDASERPSAEEVAARLEPLVAELPRKLRLSRRAGGFA